MKLCITVLLAVFAVASCQRQVTFSPPTSLPSPPPPPRSPGLPPPPTFETPGVGYISLCIVLFVVSFWLDEYVVGHLDAD